MEPDEGLNMTPLPDDLLGKILAMVPFPSVFKARVLSKSWLAKFSSVSSQDDEEKKCTVTTFQEQVGELSSTKWKTFCPILLCKEDFIGYDRASHQWRRMPSLSFLPDNLYNGSDWWRLEGALLLITTEGDVNSPLISFKDISCLPNFYVANILTRSWKQLPPRPIMDSRTYDSEERSPRLTVGTYDVEKWVIHMSLQTYKVVVFNEDFYCRLRFAEVYDSKADAWSRNKSLYVPEHLLYSTLSNCAFLNGVFYRVVVATDKTARGLLAFNVKEENFKLLQMSFTDIPLDLFGAPLVVCKSNLMVVVPNGDDTRTSLISSGSVLKFDLGSRSWSEVTRGPPAALNFGKFTRNPATDGDSLFFTGVQVESGVLAYNVHENEWSSFPLPTGVRQLLDTHKRSVLYTAPQSEYQWEPSSFQPGLNPFVAV